MKKFLLLALLSFVSSTLAVRADGVVIFNEIMYHPATNETALEWVELHSLMAQDMDVSGWSLAGGIQYTFPSNSIVRAGGYVVVALDPAALAAAGVANAYGPFTGRLSNAGDEIELRDNSGRLRDSVDYGVDGAWPVAPDGSGWSLAKRDPETASGPAGNWTTSDERGGTPGGHNFPYLLSPPPVKSPVPITASWSYEASGNEPDASWNQPGYNDSAWPTRTSFQSGPIPSLFNTGVGNNGVALPQNTRDPHYLITLAAQGPIDTNALAILNHPSWLANDGASSWIGVQNPGSGNVNSGNYYYRTTFDLTGFLVGTVNINVQVAVDDNLTDVVVNGQPTGLTAVGFTGFSIPVSLPNGFAQGLNTVEFRTLNGSTSPNPAGFRAVFSSTGVSLSTNAPLPLGPTTYYFRTKFVYTGVPVGAALALNPLVADGAVVYLNGQEMHRQNLPAGPISASTPALSDVPQPAFSGPVMIPSDALVQGENVLAMEVHQAAGSADAPVAGVELTFLPLALPPVTLAFNEVTSATNLQFLVELANYGTDPISLEGFVIVRDGTTNQSYTFPAGPALAGGGYRVLTDALLGFRPNAGDRLVLLDPGQLRVIDAVVVKNRLRGRWPGGTGSWLYPVQATLGAANQFSFQQDIVINEIMYHHLSRSLTNREAATESSEEWLELFNRGDTVVDLSGWELDGGIEFRFGSGQTLAPGAFLVVARDAPLLQAKYPGVPIVGNFNGQLANGGDLITLLDARGNPADEVRYYDDGRWPSYADGGGSSLELRDPLADNSKGESWAASVESDQTSWQSYSYRASGATLIGPARYNEFVFGLLGAGECLVDDFSVIESPTNAPVQKIANGNFEGGQGKWRILGNHGTSKIITDPDNAGNEVLHLIATGPQEHMHNHVEITFIGNLPVNDSREYEISFRAKWLAGNNLLNTRMWFNRAPRTTRLPTPDRVGTPGAPNSTLVSNLGPTFSELHHEPVVPAINQAVTVSVVANDPQGVNQATLNWSVNGGSWTSAAMTHEGAGRYSGAIPGQGAGAIVQFYVSAADGLGASASVPAAGVNSGALYMVADGQAALNLGHNLRLIVTPANRDLLHAPTNVMSNADLPGTVIYDERRAYYNAGIRLKGSERGRYNPIRVSFHLSFPPDDLFRGVHPVMLIDRSGQGDQDFDRQLEILIKHMAERAGGIPATHGELCRVIAPRSTDTSQAILAPRFEDDFIETAFPGGADGKVFELELIYYPNGTLNNDPESYKLPNPDSVDVSIDIRDLGDNQEAYRYNFIMKNHRDEDDFSEFMDFAKVLTLNDALLEGFSPQVMDIDQWMRAYAIVTLCGVSDIYSWNTPHNWMMYLRPDDRKMLFFPWDLDFAFSRGSTDVIVGTAAHNLNRVINRTPHLRKLYGHLLEIMDSTYNTGYMNSWISHYSRFAPGQNFARISSYIDTRVSTVRGTINGAGGNTAFAVNTPTTITTNNNLITLTGTAPVSVKTIKINGAEYPITWTSLSAWRITVPVAESSNLLQVLAYDVRDRALSNLTASITVHYTGPTPDPNGAVVINEIMYNPAKPNASFVELRNTSPTLSFDLSGWDFEGLSFRFPAGSVITNGQFYILAGHGPGYALAYTSNAPAPQATFDGNLQNDGETLRLIKPAVDGAPEQEIDAVRYEAELPWVLSANGTGPGLQLIDAAQDNSRVSNWADGQGWRPFLLTRVLGSGASSVSLALANVGEAYIDKVELVKGTAPGSGPNVLVNGGFETGVLSPWVTAGNHSNSVVSSQVAFEGSYSLNIIAAGAGSPSALVRQTFPTLDTTNTYTFSFYYLPVPNNRIKWRISSSAQDFNTGFDVSPVLSTPGVANSAASTLPPYDPVWLNEVAPSNTTGLVDGQNQLDPWIELYNRGPAPVSLEGYYLANNYESNLTHWAFPAGASLQPGEFKIVWVDGDAGQSTAEEWHASFRLPAGSGAVALTRLVNGAPQITDYLTYKALQPDESYGDFPDGQPFKRGVFTVRTPGTNNVGRPADLYINEWLASNQAAIADPADQNYDDWFEIYNAGSAPADLTGYFLTDDLDNKRQFTIPAGYVVPPGGFLLVWADGDTEQNSTNSPHLHVNFSLRAAGEDIGLYSPDGIAVDEITFGGQTNDVSGGRFPDGTTARVLMTTPTPGTPNTLGGGGNTAPVLATVNDPILYLGQTLSLNVAATDPQVPPQSLDFSLVGGGPAGAGVTSTGPTTAQINWTPTPDQVGTNLLTVRVTDNGAPPLSDEQPFAIIVLPLPQMQISKTGDLVSLSFPTVPNKTYRLLYAGTLTPPVQWFPVPGGEITAAGTTLTIQDDVTTQTQRFYLLLLVE